MDTPAPLTDTATVQEAIKHHIDSKLPDTFKHLADSIFDRFLVENQAYIERHLDKPADRRWKFVQVSTTFVLEPLILDAISAEIGR